MDGKDTLDDKPAGIVITPRTIVRSVVLVALIAVACAVAFLAGQGTRITEATATDRVRTTVERVKAQHKGELADALAEAARDAKTAEEKRIGRNNDMWRGRIKRMKRKHERAMERAIENARQAGIDAGYASGSAAGFSSGKEEGVEEGIEKASDDLVCSDDPDVDLPPCWDW